MAEIPLIGGPIAIQGKVQPWQLTASTDNRHLNTDKTLSDTNTSLNMVPIVVDGEWVTRNGEKLLWTPDNYRTGPISVHDNTLVLEYSPEQSALVEFDFSSR